MTLRCCEDEAKALVIDSARIEIARWKIAGAGVDPHGEYVRSYWLPIIGPTSYLLAQTFADTLRNAPEGQQSIALPTIQLAEAVGIGGSLSPNSPLARSVARLVLFELATPMGGLLLVRRRMASAHAQPAPSAPRMAFGAAPTRLHAHTERRATARR